MAEIPPEIEIDMTGLLCPLPVFRARKALQGLMAGAIVKIIATDPMSVIDMPHFCSEQGHELVAQERDGPRYIFRIRRT